jgi:DnaJ-class molecular chaperone
VNPIIHRINDWVKCPTCEGTGKVMQTKTLTKNGLAVPLGVIPCPQCDGTKHVRVTKYPIGVEGWPN